MLIQITFFVTSVVGALTGDENRSLPLCRAGQYLTPNNTCGECSVGEGFSSSPNRNTVCTPCTATCEQFLRLHPCNETHDVVCGCRTGYIESNGDCIQPSEGSVSEHLLRVEQMVVQLQQDNNKTKQQLQEKLSELLIHLEQVISQLQHDNNRTKHQLQETLSDHLRRVEHIISQLQQDTNVTKLQLQETLSQHHIRVEKIFSQLQKDHNRTVEQLQGTLAERLIPIANGTRQLAEENERQVQELRIKLADIFKNQALRNASVGSPLFKSSIEEAKNEVLRTLSNLSSEIRSSMLERQPVHSDLGKGFTITIVLLASFITCVLILIFCKFKQTRNRASRDITSDPGTPSNSCSFTSSCSQCLPALLQLLLSRRSAAPTNEMPEQGILQLSPPASTEQAAATSAAAAATAAARAAAAVSSADVTKGSSVVDVTGRLSPSPSEATMKNFAQSSPASAGSSKAEQNAATTNPSGAPASSSFLSDCEGPRDRGEPFFNQPIIANKRISKEGKNANTVIKN